MSSAGDTARNFVEMQLHAVSADKRECQTSGLASCRTDGAEQPGIGVTLVGGLTWSRAPSGPLPDDTVLLTDPGLVLEPDLDRLSLRQMASMSAQDTGEVFLNASMTPVSCPG